MIIEFDLSIGFSIAGKMLQCLFRIVWITIWRYIYISSSPVTTSSYYNTGPGWDRTGCTLSLNHLLQISLFCDRQCSSYQVPLSTLLVQTARELHTCNQCRRNEIADFHVWDVALNPCAPKRFCWEQFATSFVWNVVVLFSVTVRHIFMEVSSHLIHTLWSSLMFASGAIFSHLYD